MNTENEKSGKPAPSAEVVTAEAPEKPKSARQRLAELKDRAARSRTERPTRTDRVAQLSERLSYFEGMRDRSYDQIRQIQYLWEALRILCDDAEWHNAHTVVNDGTDCGFVRDDYKVIVEKALTAHLYIQELIERRVNLLGRHGDAEIGKLEELPAMRMLKTAPPKDV